MRYSIMTSFVFLALVIAVVSCSNVDYSARIEQHKSLAAELTDNRLYDAAVEEYQKILDYPTVDDITGGNINYLIGKLYYENIKDYEKAAAYFVKAKALNHDGSYVNEASKMLVASFEKMGNVIDARRELNAVSNIDSEGKPAGDVVVAKIGDDKIYLSDIDRQIQMLPTEMQQQFVNRSEKVKFVQQYVGMELIFRSAERENYGDDPMVKQQQHELYRQLLIDKFTNDKIFKDVQINQSDVMNFYTANKTPKYGDKPFEEVQSQVINDYQMEKGQEVFQNYVNKLFTAERVQILEPNIK